LQFSLDAASPETFGYTLVPAPDGGGDDDDDNGMITDKGGLGESSALVPLRPLKTCMVFPRTKSVLPRWKSSI
jgi:hypothetical protein